MKASLCAANIERKFSLCIRRRTASRDPGARQWERPEMAYDSSLEITYSRDLLLYIYFTFLLFVNIFMLLYIFVIGVIL